MNTVSQIFPRTGRISGLEVGDGAKPDVPTTDRQNENKDNIKQRNGNYLFSLPRLSKKTAYLAGKLIVGQIAKFQQNRESP